MNKKADCVYIRKAVESVDCIFVDFLFHSCDISSDKFIQGDVEQFAHKEKARNVSLMVFTNGHFRM